ncbi:MAG: hypothetical protein WBD07_18345 [Vicinamibacterales bacterium]
MFRARVVFAVTLCGFSLVAGTALAQAVQAPDLKPILGNRQFTPPLRGDAAIEFVYPVPSRVGTLIVTKIQVKNISKAPIARLTIDETWYDKADQQVVGGKGFLAELLQPGEVRTITIETPSNPRMARNSYQFSHANGAVPKPARMNKLVDESKAAAAAKK